MPYADPERQRQYQREWLTQRRIAWFQDKSCVRCSSTIDLELDHIDPAKRISHRIWSWSTARRTAELAKCQVLCGTCHKAKSRVDRGAGLPHGTSTKYTHDKCRCCACKTAHAAWFRAYRQRKKSLADR